MMALHVEMTLYIEVFLDKQWDRLLKEVHSSQVGQHDNGGGSRSRLGCRAGDVYTIVSMFVLVVFKGPYIAAPLTTSQCTELRGFRVLQEVSKGCIPEHPRA